MTDADRLLLQANLKLLKLPTIHREFAALAREAADGNQSFEPYLRPLTELEVAARQSHALEAAERGAFAADQAGRIPPLKGLRHLRLEASCRTSTSPRSWRWPAPSGPSSAPTCA